MMYIHVSFVFLQNDINVSATIMHFTDTQLLYFSQKNFSTLVRGFPRPLYTTAAGYMYPRASRFFSLCSVYIRTSSSFLTCTHLSSAHFPYPNVDSALLLLHLNDATRAVPYNTRSFHVVFGQKYRAGYSPVKRFSLINSPPFSFRISSNII